MDSKTGSSDSTPEPNGPPAYAVGVSFHDRFASISLHKTDRIRLLQFPSQEITAIRIIIQNNWPPGLQEERRFSVCHEFKCSGNPWSGQSCDAIPSRILMRSILAYLFSAGWILAASTDVSKSIFTRDTMIFRKQPSTPPPSTWLAISFNQGDRLRLIGAPLELISAFQGLLQSMRLWQDGVWKDKSREAFEFKIIGYPWRPSGDETMSTRVLIVRMMETLDRFGWSVYACIDQSNGHYNSNSVTSGMDSWYCVRAADWIPSHNVNHRHSGG